MTNHRFRVCVALVALAGFSLSTIFGCTGLNPALVGTVGGNTASYLDAPKGTILIVVLNYTLSDVLASVNIVKQNTAVVPLFLGAAPYNPTSLQDHAILTQDCDVDQIQFLDVQINQAGGVTQDYDLRGVPPLINGQSLSCGKMVVITVGVLGDTTLPSDINVMVY